MAGDNETTKSSTEVATAALLSTLKTLDPLEKDQQIRVIRGVAAFLELEEGDIF